MSKNTSPYHEAGSIVNELLSSKSGSGRGLKSIIFSKTKSRDGPNKATYATVCKSMQHIPVINLVLNDDGGRLRKAIGLDNVRNKGLMYVMLYELLFSNYKSIRGGGKLKRMIMNHENELRRGIDAHVSKTRAGLDEATVTFPRYVRVNIMQTSTDTMVTMLREALAKNAKADGNSDEIAEIKQSIFLDAHVLDLLVLHPSTSTFLHQDNDAVKSGKIILQDKSSCFPALVMARGDINASVNYDFIDACAAPGNKTSHLAALLSTFYTDTPRLKKNKGKKKAKPNSTIFAFERSSARFKILKSRIDTLVPLSEKVAVEPILGDFLKSDPNDPKFANVRGILLDPSCSGSGIVNSPDRWWENAETSNDIKTAEDIKSKRIQSLANFQLVALKHAMSFPLVDRIVYSTCSVNDEENEVVVGKALSEVNGSIKGLNDDEWQLVSPACLHHWPRRGKAGGAGGLSESQASCLIRCDGLDGDETNGFFVSYFERKKVVDVRALQVANTVIANCGLPIYGGQFANVHAEANETAQKRSNQTNHKKPHTSSASSAQHCKSKQNVQYENDKSEQKIAKKKVKKLAWKQKQALQKAERLKEKREKV